MLRILPALVAVLIGMTACSSPAETASEAATPTAAESDALVIEVGDTDAGEALVAPNGMTLYIFTNDSPGETTCFEGCIDAWPPLTAEANQAVEGGEGVDTGRFAVIDRGDGTLQVTYADYPLYFYAADTDPGDSTGDGVGGVWFIAKASGEVPEA